MVHVSMDLSLWVDIPMFWASTTPAIFFQFHLEERWGVQTGCDILRTVEGSSVDA